MNITSRGQLIGCCLAHRRVGYLSIWGYWTHTDGQVCAADLAWKPMNTVTRTKRNREA